MSVTSTFVVGVVCLTTFVNAPVPLPNSERPTFHFAVSYAALTSVSSAFAIEPFLPVSCTALIDNSTFEYISFAYVLKRLNITLPASGVASPSSP